MAEIVRSIIRDNRMYHLIKLANGDKYLAGDALIGGDLSWATEVLGGKLSHASSEGRIRGWEVYYVVREVESTENEFGMVCP